MQNIKNMNGDQTHKICKTKDIFLSFYIFRSLVGVLNVFLNYIDILPHKYIRYENVNN